MPNPDGSLTNLDKVHYCFSEFESPEHFITAGYLFCISSCLGRKVWLQEGIPIFPNEQWALIGPASVGKTLHSSILLDLVRSLMEVNPGTKALEPLVAVAPQSVTLEKLYEKLERCGTAIGKDVTGDKPYFHSSLSFMLEGEMGDLFKPGPAAQTLTLFLNKGYDCASTFDYETKRSGENHVKNLCVNFYGCATPDWIEKNLDSSVIGNGWASRVLWLYAEEKRQRTTFLKFTAEHMAMFEDIKKHFRNVAKVFGEVKMSPEFVEYFDNWYRKDFKRINHDVKLDAYYGRKKLHALKLAMAFHFAEKTTKVLELDCLLKAFEYLNPCELNMHKALASMNQNPLAVLAQEMLRLLTVKKDGLSSSELMMELYQKAPKGMESIEEVKCYLSATKQIKMLDSKYVANKVIVDVTEDQFRRGVKPLTDEEIKSAAYGK